jgi:PBP1b-binding outer membrane lipoprotein LpoB
MKKIILILALIMNLYSCSSSDKELNALEASYEPILDTDSQVARIELMIKNDKKLDSKVKVQLITLIDDTSKEAIKRKKRQSQLRAVLIDQLLKSSDGSKSKVLTTSKELEKNHKESIKSLNDFILKFKAISGEQSHNQNEMMRDLATIHYI